ncbi:MAG: TonB-dependent receptor, partial [Parvularculaceae bacterium]|nr:TonB-dependent receptor [Parvularculaceae bacterium]
NATLRAPLLNGRLQNVVLVGYSDIDRQNLLNGAPSFGAEGERTILRYQGTVEVNSWNTIAFGAERDETSVDGEDITIDGFFALYELKPLSSLTLTGGLRLDDHETFGSETTGRLAAAYNPTETVTVRANWGQGFKAPTLFQLSGGGFVAPNPDLQPETSEGYDVGAEWRRNDGTAFVGVTLFNQDIENLINFTTEGYRNVRLAETSGIEAMAGYQLTSWFTIQGNYTFLDADDGNGNELPRLPEHTGEVRASLNPEGPLSGAVIVRYNGEEMNTDGTTLDGWTRVDVTARYAVNDSVELFGRVENLFDEDYQQILGYGTPGLSGSVGLRLTY